MQSEDVCAKINNNSCWFTEIFTMCFLLPPEMDRCQRHACEQNNYLASLTCIGFFACVLSLAFFKATTTFRKCEYSVINCAMFEKPVTQPTRPHFPTPDFLPILVCQARREVWSGC